MSLTKISSKSEVERFLCLCKIAVISNFILERTEKNKKTISSLGYDKEEVKDEILELQAQDYVEGPVVDLQGYDKDFWVFGRYVEGREIYIKIKVKDLDMSGNNKLSGYCISFHFSEHQLIYPYKNS